MDASTVQLIQTLSQVLTPAGLIAWGVWFVTKHFWPWWTGKRADNEQEIQRLQVQATTAIGEGLKAQASAIEELARCLNRDGKPLLISPTLSGGD